MAGGFALVVGPSGAGKDTLIGIARDRLLGDDRFVFPRRIVTRASSAWEDHDSIDDETFEHGLALGRFALAWRAHGLGYAIPAAARHSALAGRVVVCNVSRAVIGVARSSLPNAAVIEVTASETVLAQRLRARGRSEDGDLSARVTRSKAIAPFTADLVIVNEGTPESAADELVAFLQAMTAPPTPASTG